jgi:hypothetical protein
MLEWASFLLQFAALIALVFYTVETWRIRMASQEQAEAFQRPCITIVSTARNYEDAVIEIGGAVGGMDVAALEGKLAIVNIGSGPAINVWYAFTPRNPVPGANVARPSGYLQNIPPHGTFVMPIARECLRNLEYELLFRYSSLSRHGYESRITVNDLTITEFHFDPKPRAGQSSV